MSLYKYINIVFAVFFTAATLITVITGFILVVTSVKDLRK